MTQVSYSFARNNLAQVLETAEEAQAPVIVKRRNHADMAIVPAAELRSLEETAHRCRSPKNAQRLLTALQRALEGSVKPQAVRDLRGAVHKVRCIEFAHSFNTAQPKLPSHLARARAMA
ncbi:MAG: type II toxin-antitoxin system prevent-host-death family antitoxin [Candidatus Latescibacteria bacterium]|nr:type II toxin-antitoxin system prevent-host-death family antitoxin [Candidatus Latescibacterota bacterium]